MAKKTRTPPPPRRVQAPQRRDGSGRPVSGGSKRNLWLAVGIAAAAAVIAIVVAVVLIGRGGGGGGKGAASVATSMRAAGCRFQTFPSKGRTHLGSLAYVKSRYNSFPPVSGPHYYIPAPWNFYDTPIDSEARQIHNLEHGGIVVQWGSKVSSSTVDELRAFWRESPNALLFAPLPQLGNKIAVEAWTHLAACTRFDEQAFAKFRDTYRFKGPEAGFNAGNTQPGQ